MRIKRLHIYGFGQHTNRVIELDEEMTLLYGLNEAGKTTLYEFILQILFGFPQKNHVIKNYEPKNGGAYGGQLEIEDATFGSYSVERVGGKASGIVNVYRDNGETGNEQLLNELLRGYSRQDIESVFAFSMHQLQNLEKLTVDDLNRTLLASGTTGVEQLTAVEKQVMKDSAALFKKSGQVPAINKMVKALQQQEVELKETRQKLATYEPKHIKIEELAQQIALMEQQQATLSEQIKAAEVYLQNEPLLKQRQLVTDTLAKANPLAFPQQGIQRFEQTDLRLQQMQQEVVQLQRRLVEVENELQAAVDEKQLQQLKIWYRSDEQWREWRMQRDRLLAEQQKAEVQLEMKKQLLGIEKSVLRINSSLANEVVFKKQLNELKEIKDQQNYYERIISETQNTKTSEATQPRSSRKMQNTIKLPVVMAVLIGIASLTIALLLQQWAVALLGCIFAAVLLIVLRNQQFVTSRESEQEAYSLRKRLEVAEQETAKLQTAYESKNQAMKGFFENLGLTGQIDEEIYEELFQTIRQLQVQFAEQHQIDDELDRLQHQIALHYEEGCRLAGTELNESDLSPFIQECIQNQELALKKLAFTIEKKAALQQQLKGLLEQVTDLSAQLEQLLQQVGAADVEAFYELADEAKQTIELTKQLEQLEQQIGHMKDKQRYTRHQLDELQANYEVNKQQYATLLKEYSLLVVEVQHLVQDNQYSKQLQEQEQHKGELTATIKKWVQLKVIEEAIAKSLENLKEQKLPKVLAQANEFFTYLTNDQYTDLLFENERFVALSKDHIRYTIDELSQATKEQAYLALRFALANEKCQTAPFPFILDDPFVHFDTLRTAKVVQLLRKLQQNHQILFFSCQERMQKDFTEQTIIEVRALQTKGD